MVGGSRWVASSTATRAGFPGLSRGGGGRTLPGHAFIHTQEAERKRAGSRVRIQTSRRPPHNILPPKDLTPKGSKISPQLSHELGPSVQPHESMGMLLIQTTTAMVVNHAYHAHFTDREN